MKANTVSLFQNVTAYWLDEATTNEVAQLPTEKMAELQDEIKAEIKKHERRLVALLDGVSLKFSADFVKERKAKDGDFGLVRVEHQGYAIEQTVPKNVKWDQLKLATIELQIKSEWKSNPTDYIETERKVQEKKYGAWPTEIKKLFEPARTTKPGKTKIEIKRKESE